jgi:hypothetical protein
MFAVGVGLFIVVLKKYQVREPNVIANPEFPLMFEGKIINEGERYGPEHFEVQKRREKAVNTVGRIVLEISSLPVDSFTVRSDLDRLSRAKMHVSCPSDYIYDMMQTLIFSSEYGDPLKGGLSTRQYDGIAFSAAKAYLVLEGLPSRSFVDLSDIC